MSTKTESVEKMERVEQVPVNGCRPRGVNRVDLELDDEFLADIAANGVTTPILVRPVKDARGPGFEIIKGHRRWSASVSSGLASIPAIVRQMTDKEAGEEQLRDCLLAKNLKPLDEARLYQERLASSDYGQGKDAVVALAAAIHVSLSTLYARLRLLKLPDGAQKALEAGAIDASVADLVATISDGKQQKEFLAKVVSHQEWNRHTGKQEKEPMSFRQAKQLIAEYRVDLKNAPFNTGDPALAGEPSCGECPRRSGNIPGLASGSPPNVCTQPTCYERKCAAFNERTVAELKDKGFQVLEAKESPALFHKYSPTSLRSSSGYEEADGLLSYDYRKDWEDKRTWRKVLKGVKPLVAVDPTGRPHEVFKLSDVDLAKFGLKKKTAAIYSASPKQKAAAKADEARARFEVQQIVAACMKVVENPKLDDHRHALLWNFVVHLVLQDKGVGEHILNRRKIHAVTFEREATVEAVDPKRELVLEICRGHALELLISSDYRAEYDEDALAELAKLCGVDTKALCAEATKCPKEGEKIAVSAEQLAAFETSYSADKIVDDKIRTPVEWRGRLWVGTGSLGSKAGGTEFVELIQVVPAGEFKGKTTTYARATAGEKNGKYPGIKVACGGAEYVLAKPEWTAVPDGKAKPAAAKPAKAAKAAKAKGKEKK